MTMPLRHFPSRFARACCAGLLCVVAGCAHGPESTREQPALDVSTVLATAAQRYEAGEWARAEELLIAFLSSAAAQRIAPSERQSLLALAGLSAAAQGKPAARTLMLQANAAAEPTPGITAAIAELELATGNPDRAVRHALAYIETWPELIGELPQPFVFALAGRTLLEPGERIRWLQALFAAGFDRDAPAASRLWVDLALARIEQGDTAAARRVLSRVLRPQDVVLLRVDRRFDGVFDRDAPTADVQRTAEAYVARLQLLLSDTETNAGTLIEYAIALRVAGMHEQLMQIGYQLLAIEPLDALLDDEDGARPWWLDTMARAADAMDDPETAVLLLRQAVEVRADWQDPVSHHLNLGNYLCRIGRADEAEEAIADLGPTSPYGALVEAAIRRCIASQRGDRVALEAALALLRENVDAGPMLVLQQLLAVADVDGAAEILLRTLADPDTRLDALQRMQTYRPVPVRPANRPMMSNRQLLLNRPDIVRAVDAVGRLEQHPIFEE
jgi:beta-barrel assembly-enhancing protease